MIAMKGEGERLKREIGRRERRLHREREGRRERRLHRERGDEIEHNRER